MFLGARAFWASCLLVACSGESPPLGTLPRISIPLEEEPVQTELPAATAKPKPAPPPSNTDAPDPPALRSREHIEMQFRYQRGELLLTAQAPKHTEQAELTPRRVGRFAVELYRGQVLIERVRFDFPLLAADSEDANFENGLTSDATVLVPLTEDANRGRLLDRKTRRTLEFAWPPPASAAP